MSEFHGKRLWHTHDYLALHARRRPHAPALRLDGRTVDSATLHRDLVRVTDALCELVVTRLGLAVGSLVAVGPTGFYEHLLATLALERLGMVAAGFRANEGTGSKALLAAADLVLTTPDHVPEPCRRHAVFRPDWITTAAATPGATLPPARPRDAPVMLARSSGTTGRPKMIEITRGMLQARLAQRIDAFGISRHARYLATMNLGVGPIFYKVIAMLRVGGLVIWERAASVPAAIRAHRPSFVYLLPHQLAGTLDALDALGWSADDRQQDMLLVVGGGKLVPSLRRAALQRLCGRVLETYGSNEAGRICQFDADGVGHVDDGIELQVVDAAGAVAALGAGGEVRVRGPGVARAYRDDPHASAQVFRDGWCYVGDHAIHLAPGRIAGLGRRDDVIDFGGIKLNASDLEAAVAERANSLGATLREVAVAPAMDEAGRPMLIVICAGIEAKDLNAFGARLRDVVPYVFVMLRVAALPRTATGKLRRAELGSLTVRRGTTPAPLAVAS